MKLFQGNCYSCCVKRISVLFIVFVGLFANITPLFNIMYHVFGYRFVDTSRISLSLAYASSVDCNIVAGVGGAIGVPVSECQALLTLYDTTIGINWTNNSGRDTTNNICNWYGVSCYFTGGVNHILGLNLGNNNLSGALPTNLSNLYYIQNFNVGHNSLSGPLPSSRSTWTSIQYFYVNNNSLSGPLPSSRSTWYNLILLDVSHNSLSGPLPSSRSTWTSIQYFYVNNNSLSGPLPSSRSTWYYIQCFDASHNFLSGMLPSLRGGSWYNLQSFIINNNLISGPLPSSWGSLTGFVHGDFSNNNIYGNIPQERILNLGYHKKDFFSFMSNCLLNSGYSALEELWLSKRTDWPWIEKPNCGINLIQSDNKAIYTGGKNVIYHFILSPSFYYNHSGIAFNDPIGHILQIGTIISQCNRYDSNGTILYNWTPDVSSTGLVSFYSGAALFYPGQSVVCNIAGKIKTNLTSGVVYINTGYFNATMDWDGIINNVSFSTGLYITS